jgi:uracil-DNA glycosylase
MSTAQTGPEPSMAVLPPRQTAAPFVPPSGDIKVLGLAALGCKGCELYQDATQTVFGKGPVTASLILVGEQPGDVEDRRGAPFVGPAGAVLWQCLEAAEIDRTAVYTTNAVKHFKHDVRGKRRIHKRPGIAEIEACHPWLEAELRELKGRVIVALGAVAARSLLGRSVRIGASRGKVFEAAGRSMFVTYHPSAVLRADDRAAEVRQALVDDLRTAQRTAAFNG